MENSTPDLSDDAAASPLQDAWETPQAQDDPEPPTADGDGPAGKPVAPLQKRRRVTRACDECRRKKIKCDGKQPCTHCTVYSYECTYDQPSNRRRNAAPQYIEALESRLKRAEALLHTLLPSIDLSDPNLDAAVQQGALQSARAAPPPHSAPNSVLETPLAAHKTQPGPETCSDAHLESMVRATGQLDIDEWGYWDYHGHSSGLSFVRRLREQYGDLMGPQVAYHQAPFVRSRPLSLVFDSPKSNVESPVEAPSPSSDLPQKDVARRICDNAIDEASALMRVLHRPTFDRMFDRMFDTPMENYDHEQHNFLPLLYAVMALGSLFSKDYKHIDELGYENCIDEGFKYFKASRQLMDVADCRDLTSLQAIVFMVLFLQSSAKLSTCYTYIGVALRSAIRMGLHRSFEGNFTKVESEMRKRTFWVIRKMDTYVGALLGLPFAINDEDIDQDLPTEVDDEYITETEILPMPEDQISVIAASNAHTRLVAILEKIVRYIYPIKGTRPPKNGEGLDSYTVSYANIREIERDLHEWMESLPMGLKPGGAAKPIIIRVQQLLRMSYAHAQMMLYRPFLHYVSQTCKSKVLDKRSYACAAAAVSVSRNIVHITVEMKKKGLLIGAYWFTMYTTFFAILSLVFFALENPDNPAIKDVLRDATQGKETLEKLAKRSMAADRCSTTLGNLFGQLPERLRRSRQNSISFPRKRRSEISPNRIQQSSDSPMTEIKPPIPRRASTFPEKQGGGFNKRASFPSGLPSLQIGGQQQQQPWPSAFRRPVYHDIYDALTALTPGDVATPGSAPTSGFTFGTPPQSQGQTLTDPSSPVSPQFAQDSTGPNPPFPDLTSMMFPSGDPFAYPNHSIASFQDATSGFPDGQSSFGSNGHPFTSFCGTTGESNPTTTASSNLFVPPSSSLTPNGGNDAPGDLDVQLFGPMPMYMMQGQQTQQHQPNFGIQGPQHNPNSQQQQPQPQSQHQSQNGQNGHQHQQNNVPLEELFNGDEWANIFGEQEGGFGDLGNGVGVSNGFYPTKME